MMRAQICVLVALLHFFLARSQDTCATDPELDLCESDALDSCANDPELDLCGDGDVDGSCESDPELDLCSDDGAASGDGDGDGAASGDGDGDGTGDDATVENRAKAFKIEFKIENIDFNQLTDAHKDGIKAGVKKSVAETAKVPQANVIVSLSAGSVAVSASVRPTDASDAELISVKNLLTTNKTSLGNLVTTELNQIADLPKQGDINVNTAAMVVTETQIVIPTKPPTPAPTQEEEASKAGALSWIAGAVSVAFALSYNIE